MDIIKYLGLMLWFLIGTIFSFVHLNIYWRLFQEQTVILYEYNRIINYIELWLAILMVAFFSLSLLYISTLFVVDKRYRRKRPCV